MVTVAEFFKILAADKRIGIIEQLKRGKMTVNALGETLGITQSAVSQHLRILKSAGLVNNERRGYHTYYTLNQEAMEMYRQRLNRVCSCGCMEGKKEGERKKRRV